VLIFLLIFGMVAFARNSFPALWPLRLLRFLGNLVAGPLFIPVLQMLASVLVCNVSTQSFSCSSGGGYLTEQVISIILAFALFCFSLTFAAVFFESHPLSTSLESKSHGRADILLLFVQAVLVLAVQTFYSKISLWLLLTLLGVGGALWFGAFLYFLPHYNHTMNCVNCAGAAAYLWLFICLVINNAYPSTDAGIMVYCGMPFAVIAGWSITTWRANQIINCPAGRLTGPFEVELKARFLLNTALYGHPLHKIPAEAMSPALAAFQAGVVTSLTSATVAAKSSGTGAGGGVVVKADTSKTPSGQGGGETPRSPSAGGTHTASAGQLAAAADNTSLERDGFRAPGADGSRGGASGLLAGGSGAVGGAEQESEASDDLDERAAALRRLIPPAVLSEVAGLYRSAAARMRTSALIFLFQSRFCGAFLGNKHLQTSALLAAERRRPALDVAFLVYQARRANEESSSSGGGVELSALARVSFEKFSADARRNVLLAAQRQASFWAELVDPMPDLSRLHRLSSETSAAVAAAENAFAELSQINNSSIAVIRLYAAFNLIVLGNAEKASVLTQEADRLEDAKAKDHRAEGQQRLSIMAESNLDLFAENTGLLTISARTQELGLILSANSAALKSFGYSRLQLERRSAFTLIAPALDAWTETSLRAYTAFGAEGNECIGRSRIIFVQGKSGAIFPALSCIRDAPSEAADGNRSFLWVVRELRSATSFILCNPVFGILGACASSLALLHLEPPALANRDIMLTDFCQELSVRSVQDELAAGGSSAGVPIRIDVTVAMAEEEDDEEHYDDDGNDDSVNNDAGSMSVDEEEEEGRQTIRRVSSRGFQGATGTTTHTARPAEKTRLLQQASSRRGLSMNESAAAAGSVFQPRRGSTYASGITGGGGAASNTISVWVRAHLQRINFDGLSLNVVSWTRIPPGESHSIAKAEARRTQLLQQAGILQGPPAIGDQMALTLATTTKDGRNTTMGSGFFPSNYKGDGQLALRYQSSESSLSATAAGGASSALSPPHMFTGGGAATVIKGPPGLIAPGQLLRRKATNSGPSFFPSSPPIAEATAAEDSAQTVSTETKTHTSVLPGAVMTPRGTLSPNASMMIGSLAGPTRNPLKRDDASSGPPSTVIMENVAADADLMAILGFDGQQQGQQGQSQGGSNPNSRSTNADEGGVGEHIDGKPPTYPPASALSLVSSSLYQGGAGAPQQQQQQREGADANSRASTADDNHHPGQLLPPIQVNNHHGKRGSSEGSSLLIPGSVTGSGIIPDSPAMGARRKTGGGGGGMRSSTRKTVPVDNSGGDQTPVVADPSTKAGSVVIHSAASAAGQSKRFRGVGSVDSGSSGGSRTSVAARSLNRLRRTLSSDHQPLLKGLWYLLVVGVILTLLAIGLSIMVVIVTRDSFNSFTDNASYTSLASKRLLAKSSAIRSLQDLVYHARTWVPLNQSEIDAHRSYVLGNTTLFSQFHQEMYQLALSSSMDSWRGDWISVRAFDVPSQVIGGK
jgi:PAS domain-containing protein